MAEFRWQVGQCGNFLYIKYFDKSSLWILRVQQLPMPYTTLNRCFKLSVTHHCNFSKQCFRLSIKIFNALSSFQEEREKNKLDVTRMEGEVSIPYRKLINERHGKEEEGR